MALVAVPGDPRSATNAVVGLPRPVGPAPRGQATAISTVLEAPPGNPADISQGNSGRVYVNFNYFPKPLAEDLGSKLTYFSGLLVFRLNNDGLMLQDGPKRGLDTANPGVALSSLWGIHALNLFSRMASVEWEETVLRLKDGSGALDASGIDPLLLERFSETNLTPMINQVAQKGVASPLADVLLQWTVQGHARTYSWIGAVVVNNGDLPPAMGGRKNPAHAVNVVRMGVPPYPIPNVFGNAAVKGAHCYILRKMVPYKGRKCVIYIPFATTEEHVDDAYLRYQGHCCEETGVFEYVGPVLDNLGHVNEDDRMMALGLHPQATPERANEAYQKLACITINFSPAGRQGDM